MVQTEKKSSSSLLLIVVAWLIVLIPLGWGVVQSVVKSLPLLSRKSPIANSAVEDAGDEEQGRGSASESWPSRTRRKRTPAAGESKGRQLVLPDDVHDRPWLFARHRVEKLS